MDLISEMIGEIGMGLRDERSEITSKLPDAACKAVLRFSSDRDSFSGLNQPMATI